MAVKPACIPDEDHQDLPVKAAPIAIADARDESPMEAPVASPPVQPVSPPGEELYPVPDLPQLSRMIKLQRYQKRRLSLLQADLRRIQVATARTARLATVARSTQRTLAECIRAEDKPSFVNLFNAFHDAAAGCSRHTTPSAVDDSTVEPRRSFLADLPEKPRETVVELLQRVRTNGDFIADRLVSLTSRELLSLLPDRTSSAGSGSVLESSSGIFSRISRVLGYVVDGQTELLASESFASPLETLIHAVRGLTPESLSSDCQALNVWSTVCARLLTEKKSGSDRLIPAVLDLWAASAAWPGKARLELWMLQILQRGAFLLERPSKHSFRMRMQVRPEVPGEEELQAEYFYTEAVGELLDLLGDATGGPVIPEPAIRMCESIWRKLPPRPDHNQGFARFVLTRWLCSSFLLEAVTLPEAFGMLSDHYISDHARSNILREVATRTQKAIFDVSYALKLGNAVLPQTASRVEAIMRRLHGAVSDRSNGPALEQDHPPAATETFVVTSAADVSTIARTLYPQRRPASFASDSYTGQTGLQSSASSVSGFSLFQSPLSEASSSTLMWSPATATILDDADQAPLSTSRDNCHVKDFYEQQSELDFSLVLEAISTLDEYLNTKSPESDRWAVLEISRQDELLTAEHAASAKSFTGTSALPLEHSDSMAELLQEMLAEGHFPLNAGKTLQPEPASLMEVYLQFSAMLEACSEAAAMASDFVTSHYWFEQWNVYRAWLAHGRALEPLRAMLELFEGQAHASFVSDELALDATEAWLAVAKPALETHLAELSVLTRRADYSRDKMWFVADVRTSAPYDEARSIASALRIMGKPKRSQRSRVAPPLRHWSASKLSTTSLHLKTEAQILELLSADPGQGGPNKLSDEQARLTHSWLEREHIENVCLGEERLHRLCMEIRKCVDQLTVPEGTFLSSNALFPRDDLRQEQQSGPLSALRVTGGRLGQLTLQTNVAPSIDAVSNSSYQLSSASSREIMESRSPTLTHRSSAPLWSPALTEARSPSSTTSVGSYHTHMLLGRQHQVAGHPRSRAGHRTIEQLKQCLTGLLLSDLTSTLFQEGSETDRAFWFGLGGDFATKHLQSINGAPNFGESDLRHGRDFAVRPDSRSFDFWDAFQRMLASFSASSSPSAKLSVLHDINQLLPMYMRGYERIPPAHRTDLQQHGGPIARQDHYNSQLDVHIEGFRRLFSTTALRPASIFRDLQYIAALVPAAVLESTQSGKAFCNAAVAISGLKQEIRNIMVETADSIIAYHSNNRGHGRTSSTAQQQRDSATFSTPSRTSSAEEVARYSMKDAADLLAIAAKEGDPVAQRELGTLYLTNPDLMDHIIAPFSRPKDVFKEELESKWRKNQDPSRCDPATMCVAHHWMILSSKGGDALAKEYLRQREEMERLP